MAAFILQQDNGSNLTRGLEWVREPAARSVFHTPHRDVALRAKVVSHPVHERGLPVLPFIQQPRLDLSPADEPDRPGDTDVSLAS